MPPPRLLWLALVPALILLAASFVGALVWLALLALLLLAVVLILDIRLSVRPRQIHLSRSHEPLLSIGVANVVTVAVENRSHQRLSFVLRDEAPDAFNTSPLTQSGSVSPLSRAVLEYTVVPFRRGAYTFGAINLRYTSALGLFERQIRYPTNDTVPVYPDILELRKHTLTARGTEEETYNRMRVRGGTDFERLREYTPDDEFRYIDWKATARTYKPIARQYQTERNQNILLVYDLGRQMTSPYGDLLKADYAISSGVVLSYVGAQRGEKIGLLTFADAIRAYLPPRAGMPQFKRVLDELYKAQPELVEPDYEAALAYAALRSSRRSLVVVFTDVADNTSARSLLRSVALLQPKHLPVVVLLMDPTLRQYADQEPEDEDGLYRTAVAQRLLQERATLARLLETRGVVVIDVPAPSLSVALVDSYLRIKARAAL